MIFTDNSFGVAVRQEFFIDGALPISQLLVVRTVSQKMLLVFNYQFDGGKVRKKLKQLFVICSTKVLCSMMLASLFLHHTYPFQCYVDERWYGAKRRILFSSVFLDEGMAQSPGVS